MTFGFGEESWPTMRSLFLFKEEDLPRLGTGITVLHAKKRIHSKDMLCKLEVDKRRLEDEVQKVAAVSCSWE